MIILIVTSHLGGHESACKITCMKIHVIMLHN
jgi:hypothetical protein